MIDVYLSAEGLLAAPVPLLGLGVASLAGMSSMTCSRAASTAAMRASASSPCSSVKRLAPGNSGLLWFWGASTVQLPMGASAPQNLQQGPSTCEHSTSSMTRSRCASAAAMQRSTFSPWRRLELTLLLSSGC